MKQHARTVGHTHSSDRMWCCRKCRDAKQCSVNLPFDFIVSGTTLPAGTYSVSHSTRIGSGLLGLTNRANGTGVCVLPKLSESASFDNPHMSVRRVGEERFLSEIRTALETYYPSVSHSRIMEVAAKSRESVSASAGGSGNE